MGPIEPAAITAATLLASKALEGLGGKAGEATWAGMGRLVEVVHRKLTGDPRAASTLEQVERHPDDVDYIRDLAGALAAVAADDDAFRRELLALVADARRNPAVGALATK